MIAIDEERCVRCGLCAADCVCHNITVLEEEVVVGDSCINCGHCIAVCPKHAVSSCEYDMADCAEYRSELCDIPPEKLLAMMRYRRSVRCFTDEPVTSAEIAQLIEAGRHAPTGANKQDVRFVVVHDCLDDFKRIVWRGFENVVGELKAKGSAKTAHYEQFIKNYAADSKDDRLFLGAGTVLVVAAEMTLDAGIAASYIELMAHAMGLGALFNHYALYSIAAMPQAGEWL
ncbi:MAG: nitroreductase family protein, partial [Oscillospiraceae bacterium]